MNNWITLRTSWVQRMEHLMLIIKRQWVIQANVNTLSAKLSLLLKSTKQCVLDPWSQDGTWIGILRYIIMFDRFLCWGLIILPERNQEHVKLKYVVVIQDITLERWKKPQHTRSYFIKQQFNFLSNITRALCPKTIATGLWCLNTITLCVK